MLLILKRISDNAMLMQFKTCKILLCIFLLSQTLKAQIVEPDSVCEAKIKLNKDGNRIEFIPITPPLNQIAGAPEAFYTYFWEFGDGQHSFEQAPVHTYKEEGEYTAELWVTNNYDNGKPPPRRPEKIGVNEVTHPVENEDFSPGTETNFLLRKIREPVPDQEMVVIMSYKNLVEYPTSGKLHLYFNETKYKSNNFELVQVRTYHGEKPVKEELILSASLQEIRDNIFWASLTSASGILTVPEDTSLRKDLNKTLQESAATYRDKKVLEFYDMEPSEQRNLYFILKTTPEMLQDTSAIINIRGIFVPDRQLTDHRVQDLEMEITTSHDPNKMAVYDSRVNYRLFPGNELKYKVRFQNNGEGPAKTIKLDIDVPSTMDMTTIKILDMYPECSICPDEMEVNYSCLDTTFMEDKMALTFKNIHLPGSGQKGVADYDSTKGFVKYSLVMNKKAPKVNSVSRTAIIFDKNEPILTNYTKTRFKPGLSIGLLAGYTSQPALEDSRNYNLGITFSPFKPNRGFLQFEFMASAGSYSDILHYETSKLVDPTNPDLAEVYVIEENREIKDIKITLVPVSYRYNIAKFISVGAGVQISTKLIENIRGEAKYEYFLESRGQVREPNPDLNKTVPIDEKNTFVGLVPGVFTDINLGSVRIGPTAGLRYIYQLEEPKSQWMFYLVWKL